MRSSVPVLALLASLLLLTGLVAGCDGDGEAEPTATEPDAAETAEATQAEEGNGEPTTQPWGALPFDSYHYTVDLEFAVSGGEKGGGLIGAQVEGDFVAPGSHAFASTFSVADLSATGEVVVIGDDAWLREEGGDWTATSRSDPAVTEATDLSSAAPDFLDVERFVEGVSALDSEAETLNGVDTRRYDIPKEAVETLDGLLGEDIVEDTTGLEDFDMTVWLEEETGAMVRLEFTATASSDVFGKDMGLGESADVTVSLSMLIDVTQINDPDIQIEPPV